jgi:hypothetical protein
MAGMLIALCLFAEASSWLHLVIVRHVVCADHGQLVEVSEGTEHALHPSSTREPSDEAGVEQGDAVSPAHRDHHCGFLAALRTREPVPAATVAPVQAALEQVPAPAPTFVALRASLLILLAPKASPPL